MKCLCVILLMVFAALLSAADVPLTGMNNADIYFNKLLMGEFEVCTQMSSPEIQTALPATKLAEIWKSVSQSLGAYHGVLQTSIEEKVPDRVHVYTLDYDLLVLDVRVTLDTLQMVSGLLFVPSSVSKPGADINMPEYLDPAQLFVQEIEFDCEGYAVHAKLTLPPDADSYPMVLMLSGSGSNDMDETVGGRKAFRDLANGLANQGVATLRWSKRTRDYPELAAQTAFTVRDEYLPELESALMWLGSRPDLNISGYYVLGHSLGAYMLPMVASEMPDLSGFIMLAGNARPLEDLVMEQYTYILGQEGLTPDEQTQLDQITAQVKDIKKLSAKKPAPESLLLNAPLSYWLSLNDYNQVKVFKQSKSPFLILQGEKDYQVSMKDFNLWKKASRCKKNREFISYPDLDHLFMLCEGVSTPASYGNSAYVAPEVVNDIAKWVKKTIR